MLSRVPFGHDPGADLVALAVSSQDIGIWGLADCAAHRTDEDARAATSIPSGRPAQLVVSPQRGALRALTFLGPGILLSVHATGHLLGWRVSDARGQLLAGAQLLWELKLDGEPCVSASHPGGDNNAAQFAIGTKSGGLTLLCSRAAGVPEVIEAPGAHRNELTALAFCPRGTWLASASRDRWVKIWEVAATNRTDAQPEAQPRTLRAVTQLADCEAWPLCLAFSHSASYLACGAMDNGVYLWNLNDAAPAAARVFAHQGWVVGIAWAPDDSAFATASWDSTARIFPRTALQDSRVLRVHKDYVSGLFFPASNDQLVSTSYDETLAVWDWRSGELLHHIQAHADWVLGLRALGGARFATIAGDRTVRVWRGAAPGCIAQLGEHATSNFAAEFFDTPLNSPAIAPDEFTPEEPPASQAGVEPAPWAFDAGNDAQLPPDTFEVAATEDSNGALAPADTFEVAALEDSSGALAPEPNSAFAPEPNSAFTPDLAQSQAPQPSEDDFDAAFAAALEVLSEPDEVVDEMPPPGDAPGAPAAGLGADASSTPQIDNERADLDSLLTNQQALPEDDGAALLEFFENIPDEFDLGVIAPVAALDDLLADGGAPSQAADAPSAPMFDGDTDTPSLKPSLADKAIPEDASEPLEHDTPNLATRLKSSLARLRNQPEQDAPAHQDIARSPTPMFIASIGRDPHILDDNPAPNAEIAHPSAGRSAQDFAQRSGTLPGARPLEPMVPEAASPTDTATAPASPMDITLAEPAAPPPISPRAPRHTRPGTLPGLVEPTLPRHESLADEFETPTSFDPNDRNYLQDATTRIDSDDLARLRMGKWAPPGLDSRLSAGSAGPQDLRIPDIVELPAAADGLSEASDALQTDFRDLWDRRWTRAAPGMAIIRRALAADAPYRRVSQFTLPHHAPRALAIDDKAKLIASCGDDASVVVYGFDGAQLHRFESHAAALQDVIFAADATVVLAGGDDGKLHAWLLPQKTLAGTGVQRHAQLKAHDGQVYCLAISEDQKSLASAGADGTIAVWNLQHAQVEARFSGYHRAIRAVGFTDAGVLSAGDNAAVRQWDSRGAIFDQLKTTSPVRALNTHRTHSVWSLEDGSVWAREKQRVRQLTAPTASTTALALRADGAVAAGGSDGSLHFYACGATQPFQSISAGAPILALAAAGDYVAALTTPRDVVLFKRR